LQGELRQIPAGKWFVLAAKFGRIVVVKEPEREEEGYGERVSQEMDRFNWVFKVLAFVIVSLVYAAILYLTLEPTQRKDNSPAISVLYGVAITSTFILINWAEKKRKAKRSRK
jgi:putative exporter of polyketide antibiotics